MARGGGVRIYIVGDSDGLKKAVAEAEASLLGLNDTGQRSFGKMRTGALLAAGAVAGIGFAAARFGTDSVRAFQESEAAMAKVKAMVEAAGVSWREHGAAIEQVIKTQSRKSGYDDELLAQSFANLTRVTGDYNESLRLNGITMDFARGRNMDLMRASDLVARVASGASVQLGRYGVVVDKNATAAEKLAAIQKQFAGQTDAFGRSQAGMSAKAGVAWDNLKEAIGGALSPAVQKLLPGITAKLEDLADWVEDPKKGQGLKGFFAAVAAAIGKTAEAVVALLDKLNDLAEWLQSSGALGAASRFLGMSPDINPPSSFYGGQQPRVTTNAADPSSLFGGLIPTRAGGGFIPGMPPSDRTADNVLLWGRSREVILTEDQQRLVGPARIAAALAATGAPHFAQGGWVTTGYTTFGGPRDSSVDMRNPRGYKGDNLNSYPYSFAELQMGSALGGLPYLAKLLVKSGGKQIVVEKRDIGGGQGDDYYDIDLWYRASEALGLGNYNKGSIQFQRVPQNTPVGPWSGPLGGGGMPVPAASGGGGGGAGGGGSGAGAGAGTGPFYPLTRSAPVIGTPHSGTHTLGNWQSDNAVDIGVPIGTPAIAVENGKVVKVHMRTLDPSSQFAGYQVTIEGDSGQGYFYTHLHTCKVREGERVRAGQVIGTSGAANNTAHLHFATRTGDPRDVLDNPFAGSTTAQATTVTPFNQTPLTATQQGGLPVISGLQAAWPTIQGILRGISGGSPLQQLMGLISIPAILSLTTSGVTGAGNSLGQITQLFGLRTIASATSLSNIFRNAGIANPKQAANLVAAAQGSNYGSLLTDRLAGIAGNRVQQARVNAQQRAMDLGLSPDRVQELGEKAARDAQIAVLRDQLKATRALIRLMISRVGQINARKAQAKPGRPGYRRAVAQANAGIRAIQDQLDDPQNGIRAQELDLVAQLQELGVNVQADDYAEDWRRAWAPIAGPAATGQHAGTGVYDPTRDNRLIGGPAGTAASEPSPPVTLPAGFAGPSGGSFRIDTRDEPNGGRARPGTFKPYIDGSALMGSGNAPEVGSTFGGMQVTGGMEALTSPPPPPTLGQLLPAQQADIRKAWALAQLSGDKAQQIAVATAAVAVFGQILAMASDIGDPDLIADAANALKGWRDTLSGLQQAADPNNDPDLQAQLAQANQRAEVALRAFNLGNAFIHAALGPGDIGAGGPNAWGAAGGGVVNLNIQSLTPSDPTTLGIIASTVARAQGGQAFVPSSTVSLGI